MPCKISDKVEREKERKKEREIFSDSLFLYVIAYFSKMCIQCNQCCYYDVLIHVFGVKKTLVTTYWMSFMTNIFDGSLHEFIGMHTKCPFLSKNLSTFTRLNKLHQDSLMQNRVV